MYTNFTRHHSGKRKHSIDRITIHCFVGQVTAKQGVDYFATTTRLCSSNYVVGYDGSIGMSVAEENRSWCSSSASNDNRAITIEVASESKEPYAVTDKAYKALLDLCYDICKRRGKDTVLWFGDKKKSLNYTPKSNEIVLTVHRWFEDKSCPGTYLYSKHSEIAKTLTERLHGTVIEQPIDTQTFLVRVKIADLYIRKGAGTSFPTAGFIPKGVYTIVEKRKGSDGYTWGKLKSGIGWIALDYVEVLS